MDDNYNTMHEGVEQHLFSEPGMHVTWLVRDPNLFEIQLAPTSDLDRLLDFGLTYIEWRAIIVSLFRTGSGEPGLSEAILQDGCIELGFDEEIPGYPLLSRIKSEVYDAAFDPKEVELLKHEIVRARTVVTDSFALRGLQKLAVICDLAQTSGLGIYLLGE